MENKKDKTLAIVFALVLGVYGGHWFYLGNKKRAWWYLGITLAGFFISACTLFLCPPLAVFVIWILAIIDLVKIIKMSDDEFNEKYNAIKPAE